VVREAVLNAVTHRNYLHPGEVLVRHMADQIAITSPGGFIAGITPQNILRHEPASRNRVLTEAFEKLRLVERAGIGRRRIFETMLGYGKRSPGTRRTDG
jgi:ATP-dependent DNA helicase RecG